MTSYVPVALRQLVVERAAGRCEYCRYPQVAAFFAFEIEHIVAEKHGGRTVEANLALACPLCNRCKGTDLGSIDPASGLLTPFFHPRTHRWRAHFQLTPTAIVPQTAIGRVTVAILQFNHPDRVLERARLIQAGFYDE